MGFSPTRSARGRDRLIGLAIILSSFAACMGLSLWGMHASTPRPAPTPQPATFERLEGFPEAVRPFELLSRARELSVRRRFVGFEAEGVSPKGTIDLTQKKSSLRYVFQSDRGRGPQPPRDPGTLPDRRYCGTQSVLVGEGGIAAQEDRPDVACGSREIVDLGTPEHCSLDRLRKVASKHGIKSTGRVSIEYYGAQAGPAFRIRRGKSTVVISAHDCETVLKGRKQRGAVPAH